jgi:hypothetical protein
LASDSVEPAVQQRIGAQLVGQSDRGLLPQIKEYAAAGLSDDGERALELRPAIAF